MHSETPEQRHTWFRIASSFGVVHVKAIVLDIPPEICKQRLTTRTNHPTIKDAQEGAVIIDKFKSMMVPPAPFEGFEEIVVVKTEEEVDQLTVRFSLLKSGETSEKSQEV